VLRKRPISSAAGAGRAAPPRGPARRPRPFLGQDRGGWGGSTALPAGVTLEDGETVHNVFFDRNFR